MGLLGKQGGLLGDDGFEKVLRAIALAQGDWGAAASLSGTIRRGKAQRAEEDAALEQARQVREAMKRAGYSDDQITLAMTNPTAFGTNFNQQFGTNNVAPDNNLVTGTPNGPQVTFKGPSAPSTLQKEAEWYTRASPAERSALDAVRPIFSTNSYGQPVYQPRTGLPSSTSQFDAELEEMLREAKRRGLIR